LKLDVPISTYLPDYPKIQANITIHQLLTHTAGVPDYTAFPTFRKMQLNFISPEQIVSLFADSATDFKPGTKFKYSNSGYVLLGYIIEKVTGNAYEQELQTRIFKPLKMDNSGYDHGNAILKNRAAGYNRFGTSLQNANYLDMSLPFSAGGLYSTVEDLYLWDQALYSDKLLPKKDRDLLFGKYIPESDEDFYGYGWEIGPIDVGNSDKVSQSVYHSGVINGFHTQITRIPADSACIIILSNAGMIPIEEMTVAINGILHDQPYDLPQKSIVVDLLEKIEKDGLDAALKYYNEKYSGKNKPNENEMNAAGYELPPVRQNKRSSGDL
jgi:CubicO group peptidase (beta-lactamase class C family)